MASLALLVLVLFGAFGAAESASISVGAEEAAQVNVAFNKFVIEHGRDYKHGTSEYSMRKALFQQRLAAVHAHNALPDQLWEAGTSYFSDRTESERNAVLGYRRGKWSEQRGFSMLEMNHSSQARTLPKSKDWTHLKVAKKVPNQGGCGSCWAFSTVSVIEAHHEIWAAKKDQKEGRFFSQQQVVDCTPNPNACGGSGGCGGATVELGMDWINKNGLASSADVPYKGSDGKCTVGGKPPVSASEVGGEDSESDALAQLQLKASPADHGQTGASIGMLGYSTLPSNLDQPLAEAVANYGPVGVAVAAGAWFEYSKGVFDGCKKDGVLDHAVTLYGYGEDDKGTKYWNIRNSYGPNWGEHGFIRMKRFGNGKEQHCGVDHAPEEGVACKNGPKQVKICGMCGILYDSVVPYFKGSPGPHPKGSTAPPQSGMGSLMRTEVNPH